jgi:hypothetical protein
MPTISPHRPTPRTALAWPPLALLVGLMLVLLAAMAAAGALHSVSERVDGTGFTAGSVQQLVVAVMPAGSSWSPAPTGASR